MEKKQLTKVKFKPVVVLGMDLILATYRGVKVTLAEFPELVSIYSVESENEGKGETQDALILIRDYYLPRKLFGSVPLNDTMEFIYKKLEIDYDK